MAKHYCTGALSLFSLDKLHGYCSARNKDQILICRLFENKIFFRLLTAVPLKMYKKFGQSNGILVGQMLKLIRQWPFATVISSTSDPSNFI